MRLSRLNPLFFGLLFFYCCQNAEEVSVERSCADFTVLLPLHLQDIKGHRDGYHAYVKVKFASENRFVTSTEPSVPDSIIMEITIKTGVPARLSSGNYRLYENRQLMEGSITSPGASYRIIIPPAELSKG